MFSKENRYFNEQKSFFHERLTHPLNISTLPLIFESQFQLADSISYMQRMNNKKKIFSSYFRNFFLFFFLPNKDSNDVENPLVVLYFILLKLKFTYVSLLFWMICCWNVRATIISNLFIVFNTRIGINKKAMLKFH